MIKVAFLSSPKFASIPRFERLLAELREQFDDEIAFVLHRGRGASRIARKYAAANGITVYRVRGCLKSLRDCDVHIHMFSDNWVAFCNVRNGSVVTPKCGFSREEMP